MAQKLVKCQVCRSSFNLGRDAQHNASRWHRVAIIARSYRNRGLSYAEIGRQVGLSRMYVKVRLERDDE